LDALSKVHRESTYYFSTGNGCLHSATNAIDKKLRTIWAIAGIDGNSHMFRHTFISEGLAKGIPVEDMVEMVGDSEAIIRKHYKHWVPEARNKVLKSSKLMWANHY